jgi:DNA modification methylase
MPDVASQNPGALQVRQIPLTRLHAAPWNANVMTAATQAKVRESIRRFGVVENLVARPLARRGHYEVLSGNHRLQLYEEEGFETAGVHVVDLDDVQARLLAQTLNRTRGRDDPERYADLLRTILADLAPADITQLLPETEHSIMKIVGDLDGPDPDVVLPPPEKPHSTRGEIYELGEHRLMCGDALNPVDVDRLLASAGTPAPALLVTDPPYGVQLDLIWHDRDARGSTRNPVPHYMGDGRGAEHQTTSISGDTRADWSEAFTLMPSLTVAYIWHAGQWCDEVGAGLRATGWEIAQQIIWDKGLFALSRQRYHWQHEGCYYAFRVGAEVPWYGPTHVPAFFARKAGSHAPWLGGVDQSTIWAAASPKMIMGPRGGEEDEKYDHPTQKPVELYARPIRNHLEPGDWLYDPFVGSGTAIIAAELTGRRCLAIDIDPAFCDVARTRYAIYTRRPELAPATRPRRGRLSAV